MSFNIDIVKKELKELAEKEQRKQILETLVTSTNQPKIPETEDMKALAAYLESLPEDKKYNILFDTKSIDETSKADLRKPENKAVLDKMNKIMRKTQIETIKSADKIEFKGALKVLVEDFPELLLRHISENVADHINIEVLEAAEHRHPVIRGSIPING